MLFRTGFSAPRTLLSALHTVRVLQRFLLFCFPVPHARRKAVPSQHLILFLLRKAVLLPHSVPSVSDSAQFLLPKAAPFFLLTLFYQMQVLFLSLRAVSFRQKVLLLSLPVLPFRFPALLLSDSALFFRFPVLPLSDSASLFHFPALPPLLPTSPFRSQVLPLCLSALPCRIPVPVLYRRSLLSH